jgi:hypothetical protein
MRKAATWRASQVGNAPATRSFHHFVTFSNLFQFDIDIDRL